MLVMTERPAWVVTLGPYGRAAYEWRRAQVLAPTEWAEQPEAVFARIDRTVGDTVRQTVQQWLQAQADPVTTEVAGLAPSFAVDDQDQVLAATLAAEIRPCLELVYQRPPAPATPEMVEVPMLSEPKAELLATTTWETRPSIADLRDAATDLAEAITEEGWSPDVLCSSSPHCWLTEPTALFPTELRIGAQALAPRLGQPVDLYLLFN